MCLESCEALPEPESLGLAEWHAQVLTRYQHCAVTHELCKRDLTK